MALLPYTLLEPAGALAPVVVDSPHSGRIYPTDFEFVCPQNLLRQAEDAYVDEVVAGAVESGATVIAAEFPRSMIDLNRAEDDIDPATLAGEWPVPLNPTPMTIQGFGLVRRLCRNGITLYHEPLTVAEVQRRIETYYRPYHARLSDLIKARIEQFGVCYLLNAHSMPDRVEKGIARPDFILGDRDGTSCDPSFTQLAKRILQDMGYRVTLNEPYKGREIVQRYGLLGHGAQALQIEINRKLYMNEIAIEKSQDFNSLRQDMTEFFRILTASIVAERDDRLAAE